MSRDLGDWQTPDLLAKAVFALLERLGLQWERVLEPTCGTGSFIEAALGRSVEPREVIGIDLQRDHLFAVGERIGHHDPRVSLQLRNVFEMDFGKDLEWRGSGPLLVVGNPPWVTSSELGALGSSNLPEKSNIKGLIGLDAVTGAANFDIAEYIVIKLLWELDDDKPTIALLVKTSVARKLIKYGRDNALVRQASMHKFDARAAFGAAVDACLLILEVGTRGTPEGIPVFESFGAAQPSHVMGFSNGDLVADVVSYRLARHADGESPVMWRQGLKHDASSVMELEGSSLSELRNRTGARVDIEDDFVFPLIKGTRLSRGDTRSTDRWVIVPHRRLGEDTRILEQTAPKLWRYLVENRTVLDGRKSSIYKGKPPFVVFGVGDYTFTEYKVGVSGLHKTPDFRLLGPIDGKPAVLDDTCYLLPCSSADEAALLTALLRGEQSRALLRALMFPDTKRPVTKKLLQRIDTLAILRLSDPSLIETTANQLLAEAGLGPRLELSNEWIQSLNWVGADQGRLAIVDA